MGRAVAFFECPSSIVHPQEPARESPSPAGELWGVASLSQLAIVQPCVYPGKLSIRLDLQKMQTVDEHTLSRLICLSLPSQATFLLSFHLMKCRMILYIPSASLWKPMMPPALEATCLVMQVWPRAKCRQMWPIVLMQVWSRPRPKQMRSIVVMHVRSSPQTKSWQMRSIVVM